MKTSAAGIPLLLVLGLIVSAPIPASPLAAADGPAAIAAVTAADDERVAASVAADRERLAAVLSDALHYAHSNGSVDSKQSYIDSIVNRRSVYEKFTYQKREFMPVAPGVVAMTGRALIHSRNADGPIVLDLNFLALWRQEGGQWKFLAWQSCRNPPASPPPPAAPPAPSAPAAPRDMRLE